MLHSFTGRFNGGSDGSNPVAGLIADKQGALYGTTAGGGNGTVFGLGQEKGEARDVLGRVYEYFLAQFAGSEGKRGGEFYTPRSVVRVMVEMLEPYKGIPAASPRLPYPSCGIPE